MPAALMMNAIANSTAAISASTTLSSLVTGNLRRPKYPESRRALRLQGLGPSPGASRWPCQDVSMSSPRDTALDLIAFLDASPSPYHAAVEALRRLTAAGFTELTQAGAWPSGPGRYVVVDGGSLFAWIVPEGAAPDAPFRLLCAHTDSPTPRGKPRAG